MHGNHGNSTYNMHVTLLHRENTQETHKSV